MLVERLVVGCIYYEALIILNYEAGGRSLSNRRICDLMNTQLLVFKTKLL